MNARRTLATLTATTAALGGLALIAPAADASGGTPGVQRTGTCAGATWKLKAKPDDGQLSVEFEVDSNRVGQAWRVRLTDNGTQIFARTRTTLAPSGSFTVEIRRPNLTGSDVIRARAVNAVNGSVCAGGITL